MTLKRHSTKPDQIFLPVSRLLFLPDTILFKNKNIRLKLDSRSNKLKKKFQAQKKTHRMPQNDFFFFT
jgi:hypothetical protein